MGIKVALTNKEKQPLLRWLKVSPRVWFLVFLITATIKTALWILAVFGSLPLLDWFLGSEVGSDADYYDAYAQGSAHFATSLWPILLRELYNVGLYSREGIAALQLLLGVWLIPVVAGILSVPKGYNVHLKRKVFWFSAVLVSLYPSLYIFTFDIYRDVTMMTIFLGALAVTWRIFESQKANIQMLYILPLLLAVWLLYLFRPYLGFAFGASFGLAMVLARLRFDKQTMLVLLLTYMAVLILMYQETTLLHPLLEYRGDRGFEQGSSSFGLGFSGKSALEFALTFILSFSFQVFGFYLHSLKALLLFLMESVPILFLVAQLLSYRKMPDIHTKFLLIFSLIYATFLVLGNDNLGTAARLRMFVYVALFIAWLRCSVQGLSSRTWQS